LSQADPEHATSAEHELLCRVYGDAPLVRHRLDPSVSDFAFWAGRMDDRRGEVVFGLPMHDPKRGRVLVLTRQASYPPQVWRVPSGGIEHGEAASDAVLRESREELGLGVMITDYAGCILFEFAVGGAPIIFPSFCFLVQPIPAAETTLPCAGVTDGEINAWQAAATEDLPVVLERLSQLAQPWKDWGHYRAASTALAASCCWPAAAGPVESGPESWPLDVTLPLSPTTAVYPGDVALEVSRTLERAPGAQTGWQVSALHLGAHCGTHVDAPAHWLRGGGGVADIPWSRLCGPALVIDGRHATAARRPVTASDIRPWLAAYGVEAPAPPVIVIRQGLGEEHAVGRIPPEHCGLAPDAAELLAALGVAALGLEGLSVDPPDSEQAHRILLAAGIPLIEGLLLSGVAPGRYWLIAAPLRLIGAEAAPCRVLLWPAAWPWA